MKISFVVLLIFAMAFYLPAQSPEISEAGIFADWEVDSLNKSDSKPEPERLIGFPSHEGRPPIGGLHRLISAVGLAFYFSLLSAFRIGWHEFTLGMWLSRMQPREYRLRATGWVRFVSGLQSLISVYLFALFILTYFGHPFE